MRRYKPLAECGAILMIFFEGECVMPSSNYAAASNPDIPITMMLSTDPKTYGMVSIFDDINALKAVRIHKDKIGKLPPEWKEGCGFYVLLSDVTNKKFNLYVGKATQSNFYGRLYSHKREKPDWNTAILFQRDTTNGFTSTQAAYIEGALYQLFTDSQHVEIMNKMSAGDMTLPEHDLLNMNQIAVSVTNILSILGYAPYTIIPLESKTNARITIKDLRDAGLLSIGEKLKSMQPKWPGSAEVGEVGVSFQGEEYSPSRAGHKLKQQTGGTGINGVSGWSFWGVERFGEWVLLEEIREQYVSQYSSLHFSQVKHKGETATLVDRPPTTEPIPVPYVMPKSVAETKLVPLPPRPTSLPNIVVPIVEKVIPPLPIHVPINGSVQTTVVPDLDEFDDEIGEPFNEEIDMAKIDPDRHINAKIRIYELIDSGHLQDGMLLDAVENGRHFTATIESGGILFNGQIYPSPSIAGKYARRMIDPQATPPNGWEFWTVRTDRGDIFLSEILDDYLE